MRKNSRMYLRKYLKQTRLINILEEKMIYLTNPQNWEDKNDRYTMEIYKQQKGLQTLLATCFTMQAETHHHWINYTKKNDGVCIVFKKDSLKQILLNINGLNEGVVRYLKLQEFENLKIKPKELPFMKRFGYIDECEYRIIYESVSEQIETFQISISLDIIDRIVINPYVSDRKFKRLKSEIQDIANIEVKRSGIIRSKKWNAQIDKLFPAPTT